MAREIIRMNSTGTDESGKRTGYFKTETKNKTKENMKRQRVMYDPRAFNQKKNKIGVHILFKEGKVK